MKRILLTAIALCFFPVTSLKAEEFEGLVLVNPANNYLKDFPISFDRVLAATNYIEDEDFEDAVLYHLAEIKMNGCLYKKIRLKKKRRCVKDLEFVGERVEAYLGLDELR